MDWLQAGGDAERRETHPVGWAREWGSLDPIRRLVVRSSSSASHCVERLRHGPIPDGMNGETDPRTPAATHKVIQLVCSDAEDPAIVVAFATRVGMEQRGCP